MMHDLPLDLIVEILSRVPATSMKRLRSTCKRWNRLFKDQRFSEEHFRKAPKESLYFVLKDDRICPISVDVNVVPPSIEFKGGFGLKDLNSNSEEVDILQVFLHCDGFLFCKTIDYRLVVWNPCSGETRWIQPTHDNHFKRSRFAMGYKNNKSCRSYKILRTWKYNDTGESQIYEFSSNSWRVIDDMDTRFFMQGDDPLSLKGNTYWLAYDLSVSEILICFCFDFTTERSKRLCLPPSQNHSFRHLSVVREEQLSVVVIADCLSKMDIWVTTNNNVDTEADLSWNKSFVVDLFPPSKCVIVLSSLIIDEEKKVVLCSITPPDGNRVCIITGDDKYYKEFPILKENHWEWSRTRCKFYVPNLLQIEQKNEGKRTPSLPQIEQKKKGKRTEF